MTTTRLISSATSLGASAPFEPVSFNAIDGASLGVAFLCLYGYRTLDTAMDSSPSHLAVAGSDATTACLAAFGPIREFRDDAINGTRMSIAAIILQELGALVTAMARLQEHDTSALASTTATSLGAGREFGPLRYLAVDSLERALGSTSCALGITPSVAAAALGGPHSSKWLECVDRAFEASTTGRLGDADTLRTRCTWLDWRALTVGGTGSSTRYKLLLESGTHSQGLAEAIRGESGRGLLVVRRGTLGMRRALSVRCGRRFLGLVFLRTAHLQILAGTVRRCCCILDLVLMILDTGGGRLALGTDLTLDCLESILGAQQAGTC